MFRKTTPWFASKIKPAYVGVYQRVFNTFPDSCVPIRYSYWDGKRWGVNENTPARAEAFKHHESRFQDLQWRGLDGK